VTKSGPRWEEGDEAVAAPLEEYADFLEGHIDALPWDSAANGRDLRNSSCVKLKLGVGKKLVEGDKK
jgi:hypothetical protein